MKALRTLSCMTIFCLSQYIISAQDLAQNTTTTTTTITATPTTGAPAAEPEVTQPVPFAISGYIDIYYRYAGNKAGSITSFTPQHDAFSLGMVNLLLTGQKGKVGYVADLGFGPRALEANYTDEGILQALKQLYLTYALNDKVKFTAGNFATYVGYESIDAPVNMNYSTAYMFSKGPFFHTGIKADFTLSSKLSAMVGVFDDTDFKFDQISKKHVGAQLTYASGKFKGILNFLSGREAEDSLRNNKTLGHQIDFVGTLAVSDKTSLGVNLTNKFAVTPEATSDKTSQWRGAALYFNQAVSDAFTLSLRGEVFDDPDGLIFGVADNSVKEITLTGNWKLHGLNIMPEIRYDFASEKIFADGDGGSVSSYPSFLIAAYYKF